MMTSRSAEWRTPLIFFNALHRAYGFTLDAAATRHNTMLPKFYDRAANGLTKDWRGERVWCNPPYGRDIGLWTAKAADSGAFVVMLVPARTDTAWWHDDVIQRSTEIGYVRGRLTFEGAKAGAPFPSAVVVYQPFAGRRSPIAIDQRGRTIRKLTPRSEKTATA